MKQIIENAMYSIVWQFIQQQQPFNLVLVNNFKDSLPKFRDQPTLLLYMDHTDLEESLIDDKSILLTLGIDSKIYTLRIEPDDILAVLAPNGEIIAQSYGTATPLQVVEGSIEHSYNALRINNPELFNTL